MPDPASPNNDWVQGDYIHQGLRWRPFCVRTRGAAARAVAGQAVSPARPCRTPEKPTAPEYLTGSRGAHSASQAHAQGAPCAIRSAAAADASDAGEPRCMRSTCEMTGGHASVVHMLASWGRVHARIEGFWRQSSIS